MSSWPGRQTRVSRISVQLAFARQGANERKERDDAERRSDDGYSPRRHWRFRSPTISVGPGFALARIVYHMLSTREAYNESVFHRCGEEAIRCAQYRLRKQAAQLGFQLIPVQNR